ncbi:phospholipase D-like domain-containing protein [Thiohalorhabdus sp. Cl-TMA]|uniref:Phospholipase D-like domain-containing protein n=1 Tax=Thiohalorhabdus methylotrophus TaxID=3242694 RepID=A0ABV4TXR3_9GAMM
MSANEPRILREGRNCWRICRADRLAFLIDGHRYYPAVVDSLSRAEGAAWVLAWDIDGRLRLDRGPVPDGLPATLSPFLSALCARKPGLHLYVLLWDYAMIYALEREPIPSVNLGWRSHRRLHFRMDGSHPVGACHHQKVVVVDDAVGYVGGFDLSKWRWDTSGHRPGDPIRVDPEGNPYPPFHDVQMVVDGEAAAALGDLCRQRWSRAGGRREPTEAVAGDPWPAGVEPELRDVRVGIARTHPAYEGKPEAREIEALHLDAIAAARRFIYIENQYLTSHAVGQALSGRLAEVDGPEVAIVLPLRKDGWLERQTMDVLRTRLLRQLRAADQHHRLRVYYPHIPGLGREWVSVHSKVLVADDRLVRLGSANMSNRSMGLDTECDLAVEAGPGEEAVRAVIAGLRNRLLAEHLDVTEEQVAEALAAESPVAAIESLRTESGRSLRPLDGTVNASSERLVPDSAVIDPERPAGPDEFVEIYVPPEDRKTGRRQASLFVAFLLGLVGLAVIWQMTPLAEWVEADKVAAWLDGVRYSPVALPAVILVYVVASLLTLPLAVMIVGTAITFAPGWDSGTPWWRPWSPRS